MHFEASEWCFNTMPDNGYWLLGNHLAKAWQAGKHLKK